MNLSLLLLPGTGQAALSELVGCAAPCSKSATELSCLILSHSGNNHRFTLILTCEHWSETAQRGRALSGQVQYTLTPLLLPARTNWQQIKGISASEAEELWALAAPAGPSWRQLEKGQHLGRRRAGGLQSSVTCRHRLKTAQKEAALQTQMCPRQYWKRRCAGAKIACTAV